MNTKRIPNPVSIEAADSRSYAVQTHAAGPQGALPLDADYLRMVPSGDLFGLTMDAAMGWMPAELRRAEYLILGISGGLRTEDGTPSPSRAPAQARSKLPPIPAGAPVCPPMCRMPPGQADNRTQQTAPHTPADR
jgi:hypothetical protein